MCAGAGLERAMVAMLRTLGGRKASLLIPQPAVANGQSGLGLNTPLVSEVEIEPVLLRTAALNGFGNGQRLYAAMTQGTVEKALNLAQASAGGENAADPTLEIKQTLETSMLRVQGSEYRVVSVKVKWSGGTELLYELEIEE